MVISGYIYDGTTFATILASAMAWGAPAVTIAAIHSSTQWGMPERKFLPAHDAKGIDLEAYYKICEERRDLENRVKALNVQLQKATELAQVGRVHQLESENAELQGLNSSLNTTVQSLKAELCATKEKARKNNGFSTEIL